MTVPNETRLVEYPGNGSLTVFGYPFKIYDDAHLTVTVVTDATGAELELTLGSNYTVDGVGSDTGGNVTIITTPPASGETLRIERILPVTQTTDLRNTGTHSPKNTEDGLDKIIMIVQQILGGVTAIPNVDSNAIHDNVAGEIQAVESQSPQTPQPADLVLLEDSEESWVKKRAALSTLPSTATGSNQGSDGVGVYDAQVDNDLQFRHVAPGSSMVTITLNGKDIDIDADAAEILEDLFSGTGLLVRTGVGTFTTREIIGGTNVTVDDGDGVAGNPTINASGGGGGHDNTIYTDTGPDNRPTANADNLNLSYMVQNPGGYMRREVIYRKQDGSTYARRIEFTSFD